MSDLILRQILGSMMYLYKNDPGLSAELQVSEVREWDCPYVYHQICRDNMTVIDIGAHLGYYALIAAKLNTHGTVYAIEPEPWNCSILKRSIIANDYRNIHVFQQAIGDYNGIGVFNVSGVSNWGRMADVTSKHDEPYDRIPVVVQTLDRFCHERRIRSVDLLRFDIEGYEIEVIRGAQDTLDAMPQGSWLFIEFHACLFDNLGPLKDCINNIIGHGFIHKRVIPISPLEHEQPEDLAEVLCRDFPHTAPRIFFCKEK